MISREETIAMAKKAWDDSGEGWVHPGWFDDRGGALETLVNLAYVRGLQDAAKVPRLSFEEPLRVTLINGEQVEVPVATMTPEELYRKIKG